MPPRPHGNVSMKSVNKKTIFRLLSYFKNYKFAVTLVMICLVLTALSNVVGMTFLQTIVDDYVTPLLKVDNPDFSGLAAVVLQMAAVFGVGVVASLFQGVFMARVPGRPEENPRRHVLPHAAPAHQVL